MPSLATLGTILTLAAVLWPCMIATPSFATMRALGLAFCCHGCPHHFSLVFHAYPQHPCWHHGFPVRRCACHHSSPQADLPYPCRPCPHCLPG